MARVAKDTFWNREREKRGWSLKYIAKRTGIPQSTLGNWFAGVKAPRNDHHIHQLCELFDIPFDKGYNEFYHAEKKWDSSKKTQYFYDTYWNKLKEKNNLSLSEISEMTGIPNVTISSHFSGRYKPGKAYLEKYCNLFDISIDEGEAEFKKAHEQFVAIQNGDPVVSNNTKEVAKPEPSKPAVTSDPVDYTFWPSIFANAKFSIKDIAQYLNVSEDKVEKYLTGEITPNFNQLRMICGLYGGIDMSLGKEAFDLLHQHFLEDDSAKISQTLEFDESSDIVTTLMENFYEEVTYKKFIEIQKLLNSLDKSTLASVYKIYKDISTILNK